MAELYWDFQQYELSQASEGIGDGVQRARQ